MKTAIPLACCLAILATAAVATETEPDVAVLQELGRLNGQALACGETTISGKARTLTIAHAPKTRRYGEIYEEATNAAFLAQGKSANCPPSAEFTTRLGDIAGRLQAVLPAGGN